jgi:serine/threonine protein kinase
MHHFHIIHYDIKPSNIVFSAKLGKAVFIDFGLSEIIKEERGFKTFCSFRGTPNYCTSEMISLMGKSYGDVDLYYNDAYGLEAAVNA